MDFNLKDILPDDPVGFKVWMNQVNQFCVIDLHYTADPDKRDPKWKEAASAGMPSAEWNREYEKSWETFEGKPVYGKDFREGLHVAIRDIEPIVGPPMMRGWDWGLTPACIIAQLVGRRLYIIDEVCENSMGAARFVPRVIEHCNLYYPGHAYFDFVDPAGFNRSESEETSCVQIMQRNQLRPQAGDMTYEKRLGAVLRLLTTLENGVPLIQISPKCKRLIEGFKGAYHYPESGRKGVVARMDRPVKNEASHPHDALQYLASKAHSRMITQPARGVVVPGVSYSFAR